MKSRLHTAFTAITVVLASGGCTEYFAERARQNYLDQQKAAQAQQQQAQAAQAQQAAAQQKQADDAFAQKLKDARAQAVAKPTPDTVSAYMALVAEGLKNGAADRHVFDVQATVNEIAGDGGLLERAAATDRSTAPAMYCLKGQLLIASGATAKGTGALAVCVRMDPTQAASDDGATLFDQLDQHGQIAQITAICRRSFNAMRTDDQRYALLDRCVQHAHSPTVQSALSWAPKRAVAWYQKTHAELEAQAAQQAREEQARQQQEEQQQAQEQGQEQQQEQVQEAAQEGQQARADDIENLEKGGDACDSITDNDDMENFCKGGDACDSITDNDDLENLCKGGDACDSITDNDDMENFCKGGDACDSITDNDDMENFCKGGDACDSITDNDDMEEACKNGGRRAWYRFAR